LAVPAVPTRPDWIAEGSVHALAWERPQEVAGLMRDRLARARPDSADASALADVAGLCLGLGEDIASQAIQHLDDADIEQVVMAVALHEVVEPQAVSRVLAEAERSLRLGGLRFGGPRFARTLLERAVGPLRAQELGHRLAARVPAACATLATAEPERIAPFVAHEHPQTIALFLSQQPPQQAAGILAHLPTAVREDVVCRMVSLGNVPRSVLQRLFESLEQSLRDVLGTSEVAGGPQTVADILSAGGTVMEKEVLNRLGRCAPGLADSVRHLMFGFDDLARLSDHDLERLLREVALEDLALALRGASAALRERLLANAAEPTRAALRDQEAALGRLRLEEVEEVQRAIVLRLWELEEQGEVTIVRGDATAQFV
jgi:flagellar motor switch protein FliG